MTSTTTLPSIFALSPDERRAVYDAALDNAMDAAHEAAVAHKARNKPDPRANDYRAYHTMRLVCVLVVKHRDKTASVECSRGSSEARIYLPVSKMIVQPESTDDFLLLCIPKWLAEKALLMGITPDLAGEWTDEQREKWSALRRLRMGINNRIHFANRRASSVISRGNAA